MLWLQGHLLTPARSFWAAYSAPFKSEIAGTDSNINDLNFWSGVVGHRHSAGDQMRQPAGDGAFNAGGRCSAKYATWRKALIRWSVSSSSYFRPKGQKKVSAHESYIQSYVAIIVLFCASGTGIFGAMREGMTGDASILIAKAFLDFFTATIFACTLGLAVSAICVPMLAIQLTLAACASLIMPLTTPMMADFTAVGGMLLVATGLRICGIKMFAVVNMLPALVLAMPISAAWTAFSPEDACFDAMW
jgi:hypothetical protein